MADVVGSFLRHQTQKPGLSSDSWQLAHARRPNHLPIPPALAVSVSHRPPFYYCIACQALLWVSHSTLSIFTANQHSCIQHELVIFSSVAYAMVSFAGGRLFGDTRCCLCCNRYYCIVVVVVVVVVALVQAFISTSNT